MSAVDNPQNLRGKVITPDMLDRKSFNALARSFCAEGETTIDASKLAELEEWQIQGHTQYRKGHRFHGLGEKGMEKVISVLQEMASEA